MLGFHPGQLHQPGELGQRRVSQAAEILILSISAFSRVCREKEPRPPRQLRLPQEPWGQLSLKEVATVQ